MTAGISDQYQHTSGLVPTLESLDGAPNITVGRLRSRELTFERDRAIIDITENANGYCQCRIGWGSFMACQSLSIVALAVSVTTLALMIFRWNSSSGAIIGGAVVFAAAFTCCAFPCFLTGQGDHSLLPRECDVPV